MESDLEPKRRVEAMNNLGDLRLAIGGRAKAVSSTAPKTLRSENHGGQRREERGTLVTFLGTTLTFLSLTSSTFLLLLSFSFSFLSLATRATDKIFFSTWKTFSKNPSGLEGLKLAVNEVVTAEEEEEQEGDAEGLRLGLGLGLGLVSLCSSLKSEIISMAISKQLKAQRPIHPKWKLEGLIPLPSSLRRCPLRLLAQLKNTQNWFAQNSAQREAEKIIFHLYSHRYLHWHQLRQSRALLQKVMKERKRQIKTSKA
ncbi:hypothetical protein F8388_004545 [Cannabis sativa]|uniref:Uncharacterized protein n=1 Tax=Cannabis sativa TaxID=3483 RepID=A0A7J6GN32_CANSA|nr:hypothetical protein F8388_004545 [Cannabis sativa]